MSLSAPDWLATSSLFAGTRVSTSRHLCLATLLKLPNTVSRVPPLATTSCGYTESKRSASCPAPCASANRSHRQTAAASSPHRRVEREATARLAARWPTSAALQGAATHGLPRWRARDASGCLPALWTPPSPLSWPMASPRCWFRAVWLSMVTLRFRGNKNLPKIFDCKISTVCGAGLPRASRRA